MKTFVNAIVIVFLFYFLYVLTCRLTLFVAHLPLYPGDTYGQSR